MIASDELAIEYEIDGIKCSKPYWSSVNGFKSIDIFIGEKKDGKHWNTYACLASAPNLDDIKIPKRLPAAFVEQVVKEVRSMVDQYKKERKPTIEI